MSCLSLRRFKPQLVKIAAKPHTTQISATARLPSPLSTAQHVRPPPNSSHESFPTNPSSSIPLHLKLNTPTPRPLLFHSTVTDLLLEDSNLPYPSLSLENITYPPSRVFEEPVHGADNDTHLKKILFWNDVSKCLVYITISKSTTIKLMMTKNDVEKVVPTGFNLSASCINEIC